MCVCVWVFFAGGDKYLNLFSHNVLQIMFLKGREVCETDKSGRFAVMSQEEYFEAGNKHMSKDEKVEETGGVY